MAAFKDKKHRESNRCSKHFTGMGRHLDENRAERVTTEDCRTSLFKICLEMTPCVLNEIRRGLPGKGCCPSDQISCVFFSQSHLRGFLHRLHVTYVSPQSPKHPAGLWQDCMCWRINRETQGPQGKRESIQRPPPDAPSGAPPGGSSVRISWPHKERATCFRARTARRSVQQPGYPSRTSWSTRSLSETGASAKPGHVHKPCTATVF